MRKIQVSIAAVVRNDNQPNNFIVVLKEEGGNRRLPVVIGSAEAQAIALPLQNIRPTRPLTHDLFRETLDSLGVRVKEVVISDLKNGTFFAVLVLTKADGSNLELDSRPSDAMAAAVRFESPIFVYESILDEAGMTIELGENPPAPVVAPQEPLAPLDRYSTEKLEQMLDEALEKEDYERAAKIRDEMIRRQNN
ncbi:MAG: bifunctional nuclease family protein [Lewinellaceae bacterium]|nr:bifunctional nuclease family protein [Lewinella sp.]MCB9279076.1 bifunctional nuclease family protein [Lewinellaceae bacterium]